MDNCTAKKININQLGYKMFSPKRAVIKCAAGTPFDVIDIGSDKPVFSGVTTPSDNKGTSGDMVSYGDFSSFHAVGTYKIRALDNEESYQFRISDNIYDCVLTDCLRVLYLQRCGCALDKDLAGDYAHGACHTMMATIYGTDKTIDVSGGWHDAGDYGRYVVPAATTVADMLLAYENYPEFLSDYTDIPESGNGIPDILDEARVALEWMFKMQDTDGGLYHKVTGLDFDGFIMPDESDLDLYVFDKSIAATADCAGAMFMAARIYKNFDSDFADKALKCAIKALEYLESHKGEGGFTNPKGINTGEYGDATVSDEILWAYAEGYRTTGDAGMKEYLKAFDFDSIDSLELGWEDMSGYAYYALARADVNDLGIDFKKALCDVADTITANAEAESYGSSIMDDYPWGSNLTILNNGMFLLMAYEFTGSEKYLKALHMQVDYIFGVNALSYCYLTGYGSKQVLHPHHRPSVALNKPMRGMVIGGPNSYLLDPYAKEHLQGAPKAACFVDYYDSYSCNEMTTYWNSPLIYILAALS